MVRRRCPRRSGAAFGRHTPIQRCQIHKARNILERLPKSMHASVRSVLRQAWELDDAAKAEKLLRNLARRLEADWDGVSGVDPGRARRDAHRHPARPAARTAPLARLHEHHRERHGHGAPGLPQRQTLALAVDGDALDRRRHDGGQEGLPAIESLQATARLRAALDESKATAPPSRPLAQIAEAA